MGKEGDELSIRGGLVAGDKAVTVKSITKIDGPTRVYNLEVVSLDGQITHNYFVGEDEIWTHNARVTLGQLRSAYEKFAPPSEDAKDRLNLKVDLGVPHGDIPLEEKG
ncbi:MAG: hypothetical protein ABJN04_12985 [Hyphomicrobiales bacterium]